MFHLNHLANRIRRVSESLLVLAGEDSPRIRVRLLSPPEALITMRTRRCLQPLDGTVLTIEDWGVGMRPEHLAQANELLRLPREVDLPTSQRLGLNVVARLVGRRHRRRLAGRPSPTAAPRDEGPGRSGERPGPVGQLLS